MTLYANMSNDGPLTAGDDYEVLVTVQNQTGEPFVMSGLIGAAFHLVSANGTIVDKTLGSGVAVTDVSGGEITITLDAADTSDLAGTCKYEVELIDSEGRYHTPVYGFATFRAALIANTTA